MEILHECGKENTMRKMYVRTFRTYIWLCVLLESSFLLHSDVLFHLMIIFHFSRFLHPDIQVNVEHLVSGKLN